MSEKVCLYDHIIFGVVISKKSYLKVVKQSCDHNVLFCIPFAYILNHARITYFSYCEPCTQYPLNYHYAVVLAVQVRNILSSPFTSPEEKY